jgi:hypothetical protein
VICSKKHKLARQRSATPEIMSKETFVDLTAELDLRFLVDQIFSQIRCGTSHLLKDSGERKTYQQQRIHRHLHATTMNKRDITGTIADRTGLTTKKAKEALEGLLRP